MKVKTLVFSTLIVLSCALSASNCKAKNPIYCYPDKCSPCSHCLGPFNELSNAPLYPLNCEGDFVLTASAFYWTATEDGNALVIDNAVAVPIINPTPDEIDELNVLIDDDFISPATRWDFGYKLGIAYNTTCDGWDIGILWTTFHSTSFKNLEVDFDDNHTLVTLLSSYAPIQGEVDFARQIKARLELNLNLIDLELGRFFWISRKLNLRPFIGIRGGKIGQNFKVEHFGGSWSPRVNPDQDPLDNEIKIRTVFQGGGIRSGFNTIWNINCGISIYGYGAFSLLYGSFNVAHDEKNRLAISPYSKTHLMDTTSHFDASRAIVDLEMGIQWATHFCECKYALALKLGWEHHLFLNQNQLFSVMRLGNVSTSTSINNTGQNLFSKRSGCIGTQGLTLTITGSF